MAGVNWDLGIGTRAEDLDWGAADGEDMFSARADDLLIADPRDVRRAETAPMVLTIMGSDGTFSLGAMDEEKVDPDEEYRYTEEYHRLYYSKNPRDPRMLLPLTRRRHHLVREVRGAAGESAGFAVTSGEHNGVVGDRVQSREMMKMSLTDGSGNITKAGGAITVVDEQAAAQALVKAYSDGFRSEWEYAKIKGYVRSFSRDQDGSRLVQRLLEKQENIVPIFNEVIAHFDELATDVFGNYVLQKLFDVVPRAEDDVNAPAEVREAKLLSRLTEKVRGQLVHLSCQTYGCRVMQKALENMRAADRATIIHELDGKVVECVFDQNANHVVQKVVEVCPGDAQFIIDAFVPDLGDLACHAYGCRVLQRTFEKCHDVPRVNVRPVMEAVLARVNEFTIHQYGNYVVQHAMLNAPDDLRHRFVMQLAPQLYALSCSKFASNVAERIVTTATEEERDEIIKQLKKPLSDAQRGNYLIQMMQDTYANYVVQRFFEAVSVPQRERISELVQPFVGTVNQSVYGRHLLRKMVASNILTNTFLLGHGIDVSSPEYGGNMNQNGARSDRGGRHGNNNAMGGSGGARNGGGGNSGSSNNRAGRGNNAGNQMNLNSLSSNGGGMRPNMQGDGSNGGGVGNNSHLPHGGNNAGVFLMQSTMPAAMAPQAFQPHPSLGGYIAAPAAVAAQQFAYNPAYGMSQQNPQQQPQPQQQLSPPQPFLGGAPQMAQPSQYVTQMPTNNGQYNFSVYSTQPQMMPQQPPPQPQQQQQQGYTIQSFNMPPPQQQQMPPPQQQQQQQFCQDGTWTTQAFVNGGGYGAAEPPHQQKLLQTSYSLQPQQPQMFQVNGNSGFLDGSAVPANMRSGKDGESGKPMKHAVSEQFANTGAMDRATRAADGSNNNNSRRSNYAGQRTPQRGNY
ncbi:putative pumilio protein [Leptomonas pyrrhocoris]|uniref:Putative pumilio protein n=1 Tax=Leptomonas pyrrhocoris TaxID=157538 RepID=A0A0N0DUJ1_LEPPY|nr:putative pumilio protein [Leptomonas pyrrhocoris]KPA78631.1 putative pumilio protein [Leptomonas pyrrhocoris]|eukprot:XP_015657070.1 putative pumilio protein [Leptomonas pyrrhocoris]